MSTAPAGGGPADPWIEQWLSAPRFSRYLTEATGDRTAALALYEWNGHVCSALHRDLAHLEIGLRNAYDVALSANWNGTGHWLADGYSVVFAPLFRTRRTASGSRRVDVNRRSRELVEAAIANAGGKGAAPGKVVAELSFGFWRYLSSSAHEKTLWVTALYQAFPPKTDRSTVDGAIGRLHELRNRIAHHEHLLSENISDRWQDLRDVAGALSTDLDAHIAAGSQVPALVAARP